jgi:hypothetical protein
VDDEAARAHAANEAEPLLHPMARRRTCAGAQGLRPFPVPRATATQPVAKPHGKRRGRLTPSLRGLDYRLNQ